MEEPLKIAVCEDDEKDAGRILELIAQSPIPARCTCFSKGEELLSSFAPGLYDLLLVDIYMGGALNGADTVAEIRKQDEEIPVAFVTGSTEYALEAYRMSVLKYIEKPCRAKDIEDIMEIALLKRSATPALTVIKNKKEEKIPFARILYLEQQTHLINIYVRDGAVVQIYEKLSNLLPQLENHDFFQPHKSFAVNLHYVRAIDLELKCFLMQNGKNVPIRRESLVKAKKALENFLFSQTRSLSP